MYTNQVARKSPHSALSALRAAHCHRNKQLTCKRGSSASCSAASSAAARAPLPVPSASGSRFGGFACPVSAPPLCRVVHRTHGQKRVAERHQQSQSKHRTKLIKAGETAVAVRRRRRRGEKTSEPTLDKEAAPASNASYSIHSSSRFR